MFSTNSVIKLSDSFKFNHQMESAVDYEFIFGMYELVSIPNRSLIRQLLIHNFVSCSQMELYLTDFFCALYQMPINCSSFVDVLNYLLNSYLKNIITDSLNFYSLTHLFLPYPVNITYSLMEKIINDLPDCILHNCSDKRFIDLIVMEPVAVEIPVEIITTKSENEQVENGENVSRQLDVADTDLKSFLLPLEQNYTKSSKGYNCYHDTVKDENIVLSENVLCIPTNIDTVHEKSPHKDIRFQSTFNEKGSDNDIANDDQKLYKNKYFKKEHNKLTLNCSLKKFADSVKHELNSVDEQHEEFEKEISLVQQKYLQQSKILENISSDSELDFDADNQQMLRKKKSLKSNRRRIPLNSPLKLFADHVKEQINSVKEKDFLESSDSDDSIVDPENFAKSKRRRIPLNSPLKLFADHVKEQINSVKEKDFLESSDNDSIVGPDNFVDRHLLQNQEKCIKEKYDTKKLYDNLVNNNYSDSDDSIIFFENCISTDKFDSGKLHTILENNINESDSDDSIIFSENREVLSPNRSVEEYIKKLDLDQTFIVSDYSSNDSGDESGSSDSFDMTDLNFNLNDLSQNEISIHSETSATCSYVNLCFQDDDCFFDGHIRDVNSSWNSSMRNVSSEPRQAKRVSFLPLPDLVSVHMFEPDNDGYRYSLYVLDQIRFQNRIKDFELLMTPYLTSEHRAKFYRKHYPFGQ